MRFAEHKQKISVAPDGNESAAVLVMKDGSRVLCWETREGKIQSVAYDALNLKLIVNVDGTVKDARVTDDGTLICRWQDAGGRIQTRSWRNFYAGIGDAEQILAEKEGQN